MNEDISNAEHIAQKVREQGEFIAPRVMLANGKVAPGRKFIAKGTWPELERRRSSTEPQIMYMFH